MRGKRGRGAAFPSDVVCSEQMCSPVSLWELWSRKSDYKGFGRQAAPCPLGNSSEG